MAFLNILNCCRRPSCVLMCEGSAFCFPSLSSGSYFCILCAAETVSFPHIPPLLSRLCYCNISHLLLFPLSFPLNPLVALPLSCGGLCRRTVSVSACSPNSPPASCCELSGRTKVKRRSGVFLCACAYVFVCDERQVRICTFMCFSIVCTEMCSMWLYVLPTSASSSSLCMFILR